MRCNSTSFRNTSSVRAGGRPRCVGGRLGSRGEGVGTWGRDAPRFPPSDPARVEILRTEPQRAYDRLGYIVVDASTDPPPSIEKVVAKVRSEAGKLGADAVVVVYDRDQPIAQYAGGLVWDEGRKLGGIAIKYRSLGA